MFKGIVKLYRDAYAGLPSHSWILFAVLLVNASGWMVLFFLSLYLTRQLGYSIAQAGRAISVFGLGNVP